MARGSGILELARIANPFGRTRGGGDDGGAVVAPSRPSEQTVPRNPHFEELLCRAIGERRVVELRYDNDPAARLFAPHVVYESTVGRLNVAGTQYENPAQPLDRNEPRIFQVGLIRTLRLTDTYFRPDVRVDPDDPRYRNGIVCSV